MRHEPKFILYVQADITFIYTFIIYLFIFVYFTYLFTL
jgi:hypothetical protein